MTNMEHDSENYEHDMENAIADELTKTANLAQISMVD